MNEENLISENLRYERKFVITELDFNEIKHIIRHHPSAFSEIFYERIINNIYLDSLDLENYFTHISGHSQRMKLRIRWYGETFGLIKKPILEIKMKNNELGKKSHFPLKSLILDKNFSFELLLDIFSQSKLPDWLFEK